MYCNTFLRIAFYFYGATHCSSKVDSLYLLQMGHSFHLEEQTTTQTLFLPVKKNTNTFPSIYGKHKHFSVYKRKTQKLLLLLTENTNTFPSINGKEKV